MPLDPHTELAELIASAKVLARRIEQRMQFIEQTPADATEAIRAHCQASESEHKQLADVRMKVAEKMKAIDAEKSASSESPEQETEITPS